MNKLSHSGIKLQVIRFTVHSDCLVPFQGWVTCLVIRAVINRGRKRLRLRGQYKHFTFLDVQSCDTHIHKQVNSSVCCVYSHEQECLIDIVPKRSYLKRSARVLLFIL